MRSYNDVLIAGPLPHSGARMYAEKYGGRVIEIDPFAAHPDLDYVLLTAGWELDERARRIVGWAVGNDVSIKEWVAGPLAYPLKQEDAWRRMELASLPELPEPVVDPDWEFSDIGTDPAIAVAFVAVTR